MPFLNMVDNFFGGLAKGRERSEEMKRLERRLAMEEPYYATRTAQMRDELDNAESARQLDRDRLNVDKARLAHYVLGDVITGGGPTTAAAQSIAGRYDLFDPNSLNAMSNLTPVLLQSQQMQTDRQREKAGQQTELEKLKHNMRMEEILHRAKTNNAFKKSKAGTDVGKKASDLLGSAASSYQRMLSTVGDEGIALRQAARELFNRGSLTGYFKDGMTEYDYAVLIGGEDAAAQAFPDMAKGKQSQEVSSGTEAINKMQF